MGRTRPGSNAIEKGLQCQLHLVEALFGANIAVDQPVVTTSWDDGHPLDLKLAEMLAKYNIPATFYLPIENVERACMNRQQIREIAQSFDVGGHTYRHVILTRISTGEAEREIVEGKKSMEEIIGRELVSFSYPHGRFNKRVVNIAREAGFIGARTVMLFTRRISNPFQEGTMVNARDWCFTHYILHSLASRDADLLNFVVKRNLSFASWDRIAIETLNFVANKGGIWHLWGHSWEIDDNDDWDRLENVLQEANALSTRVWGADNSHLLRTQTGKGN